MWARITPPRLVMAPGDLIEPVVDALRAQRIGVKAVGKVAVAALRREPRPRAAVLREEPRHQSEVLVPAALQPRVAFEKTAHLLRLRRREPDDAPAPLLGERERLAKHRDPLRVELRPVVVVAVPPGEEVTGVRRLVERGVRLRVELPRPHARAVEPPVDAREDAPDRARGADSFLAPPLPADVVRLADEVDCAVQRVAAQEVLRDCIV